MSEFTINLDMKFRQFIAVLLLQLGLFSCTGQQAGVREVSVTALAEQLQKVESMQLVDVRTPQEWAAGGIDGALQIEVTADDFEQKALQLLDKEQPVYLYCRSGGRSMKAAKILASKGFEVYNVAGGYTKWKQKNATHE